MSDFVELVLTCGSWQEAQRIADELLEKRLVACVEMIAVTSRFRWKGAIEASDEIKLVMQTRADKFATVEATIKALHSYETFVLKALPIQMVSVDAAKWLEDEIDA